jgi:hypothetical protein
MGIGFSAGGTLARTGLEGFRPAFLSQARMRRLSCRLAANEINLIALAVTNFVVTGRDATIRIGGFHGDSNSCNRTKRENQCEQTVDQRAMGQ